MSRAAQARAWWADVEDVRARIERRRERERAGSARPPIARRGTREVRPGRHLSVVRAPGVTPTEQALVRRRPRRRMAQRVGPRPDRIAAWAVVLGFAMVLAAILSAHG